MSIGSRNFAHIQIMMGFLLGYAFSAIVTRDGQSFINTAAINASPSWQFLWVGSYKPCHEIILELFFLVIGISALFRVGMCRAQLKTFKLGFYPAALLPLIIAFSVDAANTVGDITASEVRSHPHTHPSHSTPFLYVGE